MTVATDIVMPQLGESIAEGTVVKWLIQAGGAVEKDQPLLEVETEKVALDVPSPAAGFLAEVMVQEGTTVPVGTVLARLETQPAAEGVVSRVGGVGVRARQGQGEQHYSPAVKQLAREHAVDLAVVPGTGEGGRVTKKDLLDYVSTHQPSSHEPSQPGQAPTPITQPRHTQEDIIPITQMRKTIADRMLLSRRTSAHVTTFFEADFRGIDTFRTGRTLTYLPFVISAVTRAMKDLPLLNASWRDQGLAIKKDVHIGIAVALEEGLLVPVIRHADQKGLTQLAQEVADVAERARKKRLAPEEVLDGTFTITNHGGFGSLFSTPIIHQPQTAILGVGSVQKRAVVIDDAIAIRPMCYLSLSFDHRIIDGATADRFMAKVKQHLQQNDWEKLL
ncbi:MAG: Dihydrolipoamide acyltransferase component of branched-chain alpha-keto acid dehydrogenase complex [Nitrospira sp.]|nr:MAG: Dihydrolipoamide acyltransferase component of branched-chain alpha-keto acid dehydrogenase complex [Nitrospira sp.]